MEAYYSIIEHPWKIVMLTSSTILIAVWGILIYGIVYYINLGLCELKRNMLDHITIIFYFYTIGNVKSILNLKDEMKACYTHFQHWLR